jgi:exopolysaccharide biosynthesis predicted pyruvyltransferase EpsI/glycosyltransferase involved in cell wall biosynthesis
MLVPVSVESSLQSRASPGGLDAIPEHCDGIFVYPRGENSGGDLIRRGALKFLARAGLEVWESDGRIEAAAIASDLTRLRKLLSDFKGFIFFNGGGNLGIYPDNGAARRLVIEAATMSRGVLVFPQSGIATEPWLRDPRVTVWARDANTLSMLKAGGVQADLVPDAALFLDPEMPKYEQGAGTFVIRRMPGRDQEYRTYPLDLERYPSGDPTYSDTLESILETIKPFRSIVSDRLHGSLISLMLRKRVAMLPGSYLKSKSFYLTWLRDTPGVRCVENRFDLAAFLEADDVPKLDLQQLFLEHAQPALERFLASSRNAPSRSLSPREARPKRLVAISGVRNERDVIEAFVRHTTALIDHLMIVDNGSTDGTREILAALAGEGLPITVKYSDSIGYSQSGWMTALMHEAVQDPEAEWILPLDADEFLSANIRALLASRSAERSRSRVIEITLRTYIPEAGPTSRDNPIVGAHRFIVHATGPWGAKVIVPAEIARKQGVVLEQGNHKVFRNSSHVESEPAGDEYFLAHFPIRSVGQYSAKVAIGWLQYLATPGRPDTWGYHWRDAFERLISDAASFAGDFAQEVSRFSSTRAEVADATVSEGPADYLGGELKYPPDPSSNSHQFEELLRYAEVQARRIAQLSKDGALAELGAENASVPGQIDNYVANRRLGWSLILSYRRWITSARERHPFVRKIYEPIAIGILRGLGMAVRRPK